MVRNENVETGQQNAPLPPLAWELTVHLLPNSSSSFSLSCSLSRELLGGPSTFDLGPRLMASDRLLDQISSRGIGSVSGRRGPQMSNSRVQEVSLLSSAQSEQETASSTSLTPTFLLFLRRRAETDVLLPSKADYLSLRR